MAGDSGDLALGEAIRDARTKRGWPQARLAKEAKFGQTWLSNVELGKRGITPRDLATIAIALGTSTDELLGLASELDGLVKELRGLDLLPGQQRQLIGFARVMAEETRSLAAANEAARAAVRVPTDDELEQALVAAGADPAVAQRIRQRATRFLAGQGLDLDEPTDQPRPATGQARSAR